VVADVTGDGKADIYLPGTNALAVSHGRTVAAPSAFASGGTGCFSADLNGDGIADLGFSSNTTVAYALMNAASYHSW
jgi:hypothetical protein